MDLQKIHAQIDLLQKCVNNAKTALAELNRIRVSRNNFSTENNWKSACNISSINYDIAKDIVIGELKLMNIQNADLISNGKV